MIRVGKIECLSTTPAQMAIIDLITQMDSHSMQIISHGVNVSFETISIKETLRNNTRKKTKIQEKYDQID